MTEHVWDECLQGQAVIGFPPNPHRLAIYAPDPRAFAITGQISAFSLDQGNGVKFIIGQAFLRRAENNAKLIEAQQDS